MKIDREYKISAFGDYSDIVPTPDTMLAFLQEFKDHSLVPSLFQEIKINNNDGQPASIQRLALVSNDGSVQVLIGSNRLDYIYRTAEDIRLDSSEIAKNNEIAVKVFDFVFQKYEKKASRLALNTESIVVDLSREEINAFLDAYSNPMSLYEIPELKEWNTRLMVTKQESIGVKQELLNIITIINKQKFNKLINGQQEEYDGFSINVDINTLFEKTTFRFTSDDCTIFLETADAIWKKIITEAG